MDAGTPAADTSTTGSENLTQSSFPYMLLILAIYLVLYLWTYYVDKRQLNNFYDKEPPKEIAVFVSQEEFTKSQEHNKEMLQFKMFQSYFEILFTLIIWYFWIPALIWNWCG